MPWGHSGGTSNRGLGDQGRLGKYMTYIYIRIPIVWQAKLRLKKRLHKLLKITYPISG